MTKTIKTADKGFIEDLLKNAQSEKEATGQILPKLIIKAGKKNLVLGLADLPQGLEKRVLLSALGVKIRKELGEINQAFFISEAWFTKYKKKEEIKNAFPPSKNPNRQEAVIVVSRNQAGEASCAFLPFKDNSGSYRFEKPTFSTHNKDADEKTQDNLLVYLFNPKAILPELLEHQVRKNPEILETLGQPKKLAD